MILSFFARRLLTVCGVLLLFSSSNWASDFSAGPLYDDFPLTLSTGYRQEIAGPLYQFEHKETQRLWAVPPLFCFVRDPDVEAEEFDFLYPLLSYDRYGGEYRFHVLQFFSFAGGQTQEDVSKRRFTLFPIYFQQRSANAEDNYTALVPIYGRIENRLFRDEIKFVLFPLYARTRKKDVVTDNYVYPFFHLREGNALRGWQLWPFVGHEEKGITLKTNAAEEVEIIGGHDRKFILWPILLKNHMGIGTTNEQEQIAILPFYTSLHSPMRDSVTYLWPLGVTRTDDREKRYKEFGAPWPLIVFARGEGKHTSRVWPVYSRASSKNQQSDFYLWPVYKYNRFHSETLDRERTRIVFFLYSAISEKNIAGGTGKVRRDFWPFYTFIREHNGDQRLQVLSILEPLLPNNKSIERSYSPIWSIWRSEKNKQTGATSRSLLWNLYRRDATPELKKTSVLFGLLQYESGRNGNNWRVFYFPFGRNARDVER